VVAQIHFSISGAIASSPPSAPFGSIEFSDSLAPEALLSFWTMTEQKLRSVGIKKIVIKDAAQQYRPQPSALLHALLLNAGFSISSAELSSAIVIDEPNFENKISHAEVKTSEAKQKRGT